MKRWLIPLLVIFLSVSVAFARQGTTKKTRTEKKLSQKTEKSKKQKEQEEPYKAVLVAEASTGKIIEENNIHLRWPPASITKLMVAYIVMEKVNRGEVRLTDRITISGSASKMGGSQVYLKEGESFNLEELMKAMLVASANDAAYAIAEFISGTKEEFLRLMNEKTKAMNMADTEFHSVHGLPPSEGEKEDLTSCHDLLILSQTLLKYPEVLMWTSIKTDSFRNGQLVMNNHNRLLQRMDQVDGLKTGYYKKSGYNIVATAKKGDLRLIVVVLGSPTARIRDGIVLESLKKVFAQYEMIMVIKKGDEIDKEILLPQGKEPKLKGITAEAFSYLVPRAKKGVIRKAIHLPEKMEGEISKGQKLGEVTITLENEVIGKVDIISPNHIPKAGIIKRLFR